MMHAQEPGNWQPISPGSKSMQMQFSFQHKVSARSVFAYDHTLCCFLVSYHLISSQSLDVCSITLSSFNQFHHRSIKSQNQVLQCPFP